MNILGQTGLKNSKQVQIEQFLKTYKIDILHCQEINIENETFESCNFINSSYNIIPNNASNKYGTCTLVSSNLQTSDVKVDTNGRMIMFNIEDVTFANVYLPSGNNPSMRQSRENYFAEVIPQLLVNSCVTGCIGGDWNSIICEKDASNNAGQKMSSSLKRLTKIFNWTDSYRYCYPHGKSFSHYYESNTVEGGTRIDRQYHWGNLVILEAKYVGIAFSDHMALIISVKLPTQVSRLSCPKSRPFYKPKPFVIKDKIFKKRLEINFNLWLEVKSAGLNLLLWWEHIVKPGIKKLLIQREKEINKEQRNILNALVCKQSYFVQKIQQGEFGLLKSLKEVQSSIQTWYQEECQKILLQSRTKDINSHESVRIYHHEIHANYLKKSSILKLNTEKGVLEGHSACASYLEEAVGDLLLHPAALCDSSQETLLKEVRVVFTDKDNDLLLKEVTKEEVKNSLMTANMDAAPGTDSLTNLVYKECWGILGDSLTEIAQAVLNGEKPTRSQRTSLMVYGNKANKPPNSPDPKHKRRISLLNSDFKIISGIPTNRLKKVATHTLNKNQLAAGDNRRIHHGINKARNAIFMASSCNEGSGILDNDYMAAFDLMVLTWVLEC